jgi:hypothetical protein
MSKICCLFQHTNISVTAVGGGCRPQFVADFQPPCAMTSSLLHDVAIIIIIIIIIIITIIIIIAIIIIITPRY